MRDLKNKLTSGKNTKNTQSRKGKSFGYQVLGFGAGGGIISDFIVATGGTITESGDYKIHTFTGPGTFSVANLSPGPSGNPNSVDYMVVAAGGGGGGSSACYGGGTGGGAGGFRESPGTNSGSYSVSPLGTSPAVALPVTKTGYPITVGAGGTAGLCSPFSGGNGSPSIFSTITATGGGGGRFCNQVGIPGGSGSGGGFDLPGGGGTFPGVAGGSGNTPPVSPSQGSSGGSGFTIWSPFSTSGAGGGATATGGTAGPPGTGNNGGNGATTSISASPTAYAGGGGGGSYNTPSSSGGSGGGGAGSATPGTPGVNGSTNLGGGGGGAGPTPGGTAGAGGSGIVIIRYKFQ